MSSANSTFRERLYKSRFFLLLMFPCFAYYVIFRYVPMWGILISFKDYKLFKGFFASKWVGLQNYADMFASIDFGNLVRNSFLLGFFSLIIEFPMPIILALVLNEVRKARLKKFIQTVSYLPYFMSTVVVVGMIHMFLNPRNGIANTIITSFGGESINFMVNASYFRPIYIISDIWQYTGWGAIIYLAALSSVDVQLYESAIIDGANKWKQLIYVTLPCIAPVIITMLLLNTGSIVDIGFEKVFLMANAAINSKADVIVTYVYRQGLLSGNVSYGTAFGTFNSVVNLFFIFGSNWIARRYSETSLF